MLLFQEVSPPSLVFGEAGERNIANRQSCLYDPFDVNKKGNTENDFIKLFS